MICASLNFAFFIQILLGHNAGKILLENTNKFPEDHPTFLDTIIVGVIAADQPGQFALDGRTFRTV